MFALMPLSPEKSKQLIKQSLYLYRKTLTNDQLQGILTKHTANNPLYVRLFCEELRLHGLYGMAGEGVDLKIKQLPGNVWSMLLLSSVVSFPNHVLDFTISVILVQRTSLSF